MRYEDSIRQIKGVGEKAEQRFHKLDIWNVGDLLEHLLLGQARAVQLVEHLAVFYEQYALRTRRGLHGVRDHEDGLTLFVYLLEQAEQLVGAL